MAVLRSGMIALAATLPFPALAQTAPAQDPGIVVSGQLEKMSDWHVAESDHVIVYSDGSKAELARITHNLERLHFLLSVLLNRVGGPDDALKLRITLVGNGAEFDAMNLRNIRSQQGPFARAFPIQRYYDPREDGAVMANSRTSQSVEIEPAAKLDLRGIGGSQLNPQTGQVESLMFGSDISNTAVTTSGNVIPLSAEGRVYAGYAQHFLLTYFPAAYPRWYLDGIGEMFSTIGVGADGTIDYGRMPEGYRRVMESYPTVPVEQVVTGRYLTDAKTRWNPFHAWILTHYLFFSETRRPQLSRYLASIGRGASPAQAASVFGDLGKLQSEVKAYDNTKLIYERLTYPPERAAEPNVRQLTEGQAAFLKGRIELGSRVEIPAGPARGMDAKTAERAANARASAIAARDRWLARLRERAQRNPDNLEAQLLLAEAECRSGNDAQCLTAAEAALGNAPADSRALAWKGTAQAQLAIAGPASQRSAGLRAARATIVRANRADAEASLPLLAYYRSFANAGEPAPKPAVEGLLKAVQNVPAAPGPRLLLGQEFARTGFPDAAKEALLPVANGPYESPERPKAEAVLETLPAK